MQGLMRKVVYVGLYETIAVACLTASLTVVSGQGVEQAGIASVITSAIAIAWNLIFNTLFEAWEKRQRQRGRSVLRRAVHALAFEGGLVLAIVPFFAWWFDMSLAASLAVNLGMVLFFLVYSFAFTWAFDLLFGLPASARAA